MAKHNNLLIIFAKRPNSKNSKTRIASETSFRFKVEFAEACLKDLIFNTNKGKFDRIFACDTYWDMVYFYNKYHLKSYSLNNKYQRNDINFKFRAIFSFFQKKYDRVILVPMDVPFLDGNFIESCFDLLDGNDYVIGPENNGGVYLIGLNKQTSLSAFSEINWGKGNSFNELTGNLKGYKYQVLEYQDDFNEIKDIVNNKEKIFSKTPHVSGVLKNWNY